MKRLIFACIALIATPAFSLAQSDDILNKHVVQPEVWRPAQNSNTRVNARGDLGFTIPVTTIPGRNGLDFTVKLSYRSGIKVRQESSWVGLGWSFDPGSITRQVNGGKYVGGTFYGVDFAGNESYLSDVYFATLPNTSFSFAKYSGTASNPSEPPRGSLQNFYALNWRPWTIVAETENPLTVGSGYEAMTAEYVYPSEWAGNREEIAAFILTDENGKRYVFGHPTMASYRVIYPAGTNSSFANYVSTWRLLAILGTDYKEIEGPVDESDLPTKNSYGSWIRFHYSAHAKFRKEPDANGESGSLQTSYLTSIETPTHTAIFSTSPKTALDDDQWYNDTDPFKKLNSLSVYKDYNGLNRSDLVERVVFDISASVPSIHENDRYQLYGIQRYGQDNATRLPGYKFTYHSQSISSVDVDDPSDRTDHFGYFTTGDGEIKSDIDTDTTDAKAWSLKSVVYPAGARDEFTYLNDVISTQCVGWKKVYRIDPPTTGNYCASAEGYYQGGTRLAEVEHFADEDDNTPESVTQYEYGSGALSGTPTGTGRSTSRQAIHLNSAAEIVLLFITIGSSK